MALAAAAAAPALSKIAIENQKPGTPESIWQVDPGQNSTTIQGFTTAISTNLGGTVSFKINNQTGRPNYQISIYRLGYYGGDGATLVATLQHQAATSVVQPAPLKNAATGLVDAGNWQVTDTWAVPTTATSGVYVANVIDGTQVFQIPFVVRDDSSHSDIVFQTADETWQAYNGWGGNNVYGGTGPGYQGAAYAVSYNRPITTRDSASNGGEFGTVNDMVFSGEYPAIQWMERNGYDVSYISGLDAATNGALLKNHKVYMDAGHDEYWTDSQRANVQAAADAGVNLVFLSGNEIYWQTRFAPSIDPSASANRTMVTYKDTHANALIDPTGVATGSFMDPRFASSGGMSGQPSNSLSGTVFQVDSDRYDVIQIPYDMTKLRFWRNTAVANTAPGQTAALQKNLLGYEWDASPDNGFRPGGLINLSSTTLAVNTKLLDYGNTVGSGTATHNLVEYRDPVSGALVFGAGTVFWSWGLSDDHDSIAPTSNPVDPNVQQATVNLLADMGVQPTTLQASLVIASQSTDHTAPTSTITSISTTNPTEGQTVTVAGTATDTGGVIGGVEVSSDGGTTWHPATASVGTASVNWSYSFKAGPAGATAVRTRAVDDSLNVGTPTAGTPISIAASSNLTLFSPTDTPAVISDVDTSSIELGVKFTSATSGQITGIRFYKGPQNTGVHLGDLWSSNGTLLASATFSNETASGWQQVNFATPVTITAGTTYIASYHTNVGRYSTTDYYFDTPGHSNGSLTAPGNGLNGFYAYGSGPIFPNTVSIVKGDNYWVDVVFKDTSQQVVANPDSGFSVDLNSSVTIAASALLANDTDPNGLPLSITGVSNPSHGLVSYDANAKTVTFTPTAGYVGSAGFTYAVADANGATASSTVSLTVSNPASQSLFSASSAPVTVNVNDTASVELGVKFVASANGTISGIRFYKGSTNTGTHVADLWSSTGTLLASATFTGETASGWQQVNFANPVSITAGTTYVASYHTAGHYSADANYFNAALTSGRLTAPSSASSGGNGVYAYGTGSLFPASTYQASNYWVDVVYNQGQAGANQPPVAVNDSGFTTNQDSPLTIAAAGLIANDNDPDGDPLTITGVSNFSHGTAAFNSQTNAVTFTPTAGYTGAAGFSYTISDGRGGTASAAVSLTVQPSGTGSGTTLFSSADRPNATPDGDPSPVELGVKFTVSAAGTITGLRYYKSAQDTGTHVGALWTSTGTLLASATFTNETASGWQQVNFASPVQVTAGTSYVAGYHSNGHYIANANYFTAAHTSGPLSAPSSASSGGNGVYAYGAAGVFPTQSFGAANYWADVVYSPNQGGANQPPVAVNDSGFSTNQDSALTIAASNLLANDSDPNGDPLAITGVGNFSHGTAAFNSQTNAVTFTPTAGYSGAAGFNYTISDGRGGTASASVAVTVQPSGTGTASTIFAASATPATPTVNDPNQVELGLKFQADVAGTITGIRFYKGAGNTGPHDAHLWTSTGTLLASATFTNESASGWQTVALPQPVAIQPGTTYLVSYHSNGNYSATGNFFGANVDSGHLHALSDASSGGNGVYAYGASGVFPTSNFNKTNYYVDVAFQPQLAA